MTEIPAHLLARARLARQTADPETEPTTVEVPIEKLEILKEWLDRGQDTPFTKDGYNVVYLLQYLVDLIPKPTYEPDPGVVQRYANALRYSPGASRDELIQLHNAGLTVSLDQSERN